jgi:hypothetical protein
MISGQLFVSFPVLHDHRDIFVRVFQHIDIRQRIAIDQQQIGERADFDDSQFAGIGTAFAGEREKFRVVGGSHFQNFRRGVPLDHSGELFGLSREVARIEQNVGAPRRFDFVFFGQAVGRIGRSFCRSGCRGRCQAETGSVQLDCGIWLVFEWSAK